MFNLPDIWKFDRVQPFLAAFVAKNEVQFTHRGFATELGWPASLLNDLLGGRRGLSIARAAEFARYFKMSGPDTERLIFLSMRDAEGTSLHGFIDNYLQTGGKQVRLRQPQEEPQTHIVSSELMGDFAAMTLHIYLLWCDGRTTEDEAAELLNSVPGLNSRQAIDEKLKLLRSAEVISGEAPQFKIEKRRLVCGGMKRDDFSSSFDFLQALAHKPENRVTWNTGKVVFPKAQHAELVQRITQLRNWIIGTTIKGEGGDSKKDCLPLQVHLCVSHLLDLEKLNLAIRTGTNADHELVATN